MTAAAPPPWGPPGALPGLHPPLPSVLCRAPGSSWCPGRTPSVHTCRDTSPDGGMDKHGSIPAASLPPASSPLRWAKSRHIRKPKLFLDRRLQSTKSAGPRGGLRALLPLSPTSPDARLARTWRPVQMSHPPSRARAGGRLPTLPVGTVPQPLDLHIPLARRP